MIIRAVTAEDAERLLAIYAPYVKNTAITFEYTVPEIHEFKARIEGTLKKYPYIAAERSGEILGYAYTGAFVARKAYDHSAETSIYLRDDMRKQGIGKRLYSAIEEISKAQNILNLYACIGYPDPEDEFLTKNSALFHEHMGYTTVGRFKKCGYKFGRWYDMIWMEKALGEHTLPPKDFIKFPDLAPDILLRAGLR